MNCNFQNCDIQDLWEGICMAWLKLRDQMPFAYQSSFACTICRLQDWRWTFKNFKSSFISSIWKLSTYLIIPLKDWNSFCFLAISDNDFDDTKAWKERGRKEPIKVILPCMDIHVDSRLVVLPWTPKIISFVRKPSIFSLALTFSITKYLNLKFEHAQTIALSWRFMRHWLMLSASFIEKNFYSTASRLSVAAFNFPHGHMK